LAWLPPLHWASISCLAQSSFASTAARDQSYFVWERNKGKSTGSDHLLTYIRYFNLVCVMRMSNLASPPPPHCATISCLALSTSSSSAASDQCYVVWEGSKGKSTSSDHLLIRKHYCNLVCELWRSNLAWLPPLHWASISCLALSTSTPSAASDQ